MVTIKLTALKVKSEHDNELVEALLVSNHIYIDIHKNCSLFSECLGQILLFVKCFISVNGHSSVQAIFQLVN